MKKLLLFLLICISLEQAVSAQPINNPDVHYLDDSLFLDVIPFGTDSVCYDRGNATLIGKSIQPRNYEEERIELKFADFHILWLERCSWTRLGNGSIRMALRCWKDLFFSVEPRNNLYQLDDSTYCLPICADLYDPIGEDSIYTYKFEPARNVNIYQLKVNSHEAVIDQLVGKTDNCGLITIDVPADKDSYYGFHLSGDTIYWLHFYGQTNKERQNNWHPTID